MSDQIRTAIAAADGGDPLPELRRLRESEGDAGSPSTGDPDAR